MHFFEFGSSTNTHQHIFEKAKSPALMVVTICGKGGGVNLSASSWRVGQDFNAQLQREARVQYMGLDGGKT